MEYLIFIIPIVICFSSLIIQLICAIRRMQKAEKARVEKIAAEAEARNLREQERARRRIEAEEERRRREEQKALQREQQRRIAEETRKLREQEMSEHQQMIAEQRRLMTASLRYKILCRDGFRCVICGASASDGVKLHVDHIIPVSKGGKTEASNLRTLCERCNLGKGDKIEYVSALSAITHPVTPTPLPMSEGNVESYQNLSKSSAICTLNAFGIRYVDNTDRGGCLWIELTPVSATLMHDKTIDGKEIRIAQHSKAFSNAPAMYIK